MRKRPWSGPVGSRRELLRLKWPPDITEPNCRERSVNEGGRSMKKQLIRAIETNERWGYRSGDVLELSGYSPAGHAMAKNVTRPNQYGKQGYALLNRSEYEYIDEPSDKVRFVITWRLLGIPVWRKTIIEKEDVN